MPEAPLRFLVDITKPQGAYLLDLVDHDLRRKSTHLDAEFDAAMAADLRAKLIALERTGTTEPFVQGGGNLILFRIQREGESVVVRLIVPGGPLQQGDLDAIAERLLRRYQPTK